MKDKYHIQFCARCGHSEAMHIKCPSCGTIHCYMCLMDKNTDCTEFVMTEPSVPAKPSDSL